MRIDRHLREADLVIGGVLIPGASAPKLITREHVKTMKPGSVIVDVAIDQGGCAETSRPTTHDDPTYVVDGVIHYCVANMPGGVPKTSTHALNNATLPFALALADKGWKQALKDDPHLRIGPQRVERQDDLPTGCRSAGLRACAGRRSVEGRRKDWQEVLSLRHDWRIGPTRKPIAVGDRSRGGPMEYFVQQLINGVTLGSIYGLIAIGYTMVYGIIGMINFAHGDIFMVGLIHRPHRHHAARHHAATPLVLLLLALRPGPRRRDGADVGLGLDVERIAYRPLRGSFRLAPLISAIGMSIVLSELRPDRPGRARQAAAADRLRRLHDHGKQTASRSACPTCRS